MVDHTPRVFRILLPTRDLEASVRFYERLLATKGRAVAEGRVYFDCGSVILGLLDYSTLPADELRPPAEAVYLATEDLDGVHRRARELGSLSQELLHGDPSSPMGEPKVRPWGERSFYANDPAGNPLCFVEASTVFTGTPAQVEGLRRASRGSK